MAGPESALGMLLFVLLSFGSNSRDLVSYLNADDYFKSRQVEVTVEKMLDLAAKSPVDGKDQVMQLLAIRKLTANPAEARRDRRVRALLAEIAEGKKGKDRLGFAEEYARRALAQLDGKQIATSIMPKNSLRSEAFKWFPKDAALVAGFDLRPVEGIPAVEVGALQEAVTKFTRQTNMEEIFDFIEKVGNIRLDRFSVGLAPDPQGGKNARIYVRITGKADHRRLVNFLRDTAKVEIVREERGADKELITFLRAGNRPPVIAVVGDSDLLLGGYMRDEGDHMAILREMLEVRGGKQQSVTTGPLADRLKKAHAQTFILMAGDITKELGLGPLGAPGVDGKQTLPKAVAMEATRKANGLDIVVDAVMENEADARRLADEASKGLRDGFEDIQRELKRKDVPKEASELLTKTLETVKIQAKAATISISIHVSNEVMKAVPDLLGKIGAIPGAPPPPPELKKEFNEIKEFKKIPNRQRRDAPPPGASGRRAGMPALAPRWTAAAVTVGCPSQTSIWRAPRLLA